MNEKVWTLEGMRLQSTNIITDWNNIIIKLVKDAKTLILCSDRLYVHAPKTLTKVLNILVLIDDELNWSSHVDKITKTTQRNISVIRRAKIYLPQNSLKLLYNSLVLPHFDYCSAVWSNRYQSQTTQLRKVQKRAARLILNQSYETPSAELFTNLKWMTLDERFEFNRVVMIYKCLHNCAPSYLQSDLINPSDFHDHFTRHTISGKLSLEWEGLNSRRHATAVNKHHHSK